MAMPFYNDPELLLAAKQRKRAAFTMVVDERRRGWHAIQAALQAELKADAIAKDKAEAPEPTMPLAMERIDGAALPSTLTPDNIVLDEYQSRAMELCNQQFGCLVGAAGTGKTTVTKQLIERVVTSIRSRIFFEDASERYTTQDDIQIPMALCSFTGKAVQQFKRAVPEYLHQFLDTIHGTLGYAPVYEDYQDPETREWKTRRVFRPTFTASNKLNVRLCIVDEAGMCPIYLWNELIAALPDDCVVILVGDICQLPPVQGRSVLGFAMLEWPTYMLEKVWRTAEDSPIIANAHRILRGETPVPAPDNGFYMQELPDSSSTALGTLIAAIKQLTNSGFFDPLQDALIVPQNKGTLGQVAINQHLVDFFNPPRFADGICLNPRTVIKAGFTTAHYAVGDKVMLHQNIRELQLTNGMIGIITSISKNGLYNGTSVDHHEKPIEGTFCLDTLNKTIAELGVESTDDEAAVRQASHIVDVQFQNTEISIPFSTAGAFNNLSHAYAFTCHKAQGSEFRNVVTLAHSANLRMLCREWLYTADTRAQKQQVILYNKRGLHRAIRIQRITGNSIQEKAKAFLALQDQQDTALPNLPPPRQLGD